MNLALESVYFLDSRSVLNSFLNLIFRKMAISDSSKVHFGRILNMNLKKGYLLDFNLQLLQLDPSMHVGPNKISCVQLLYSAQTLGLLNEASLIYIMFLVMCSSET